MPLPTVPPNKSLQRAGDDKLHAPYRHSSVQACGSALQVWLAAAELCRYAA
jgi:hypothetical protein